MQLDRQPKIDRYVAVESSLEAPGAPMDNLDQSQASAVNTSDSFDLGHRHEPISCVIIC